MSEITYDTNMVIPYHEGSLPHIMSERTTTNGTEPLDEYDREIARYEELFYTLGKEFVSKPNKEFLGLDLWKFLEDFPQVKSDIDHYIRHRLVLLRTELHNNMVNAVNEKIIRQLEQQLKEKENGQ